MLSLGIRVSFKDSIEDRPEKQASIEWLVDSDWVVEWLKVNLTWAVSSFSQNTTFQGSECLASQQCEGLVFSLGLILEHLMHASLIDDGRSIERVTKRASSRRDCNHWMHTMSGFVQ